MFTLALSPPLLYLLLYLLIVLVSLLGDHLLRLLPVQSHLLHLLIALSDTAIHGLISSCCWAMTVLGVYDAVKSEPGKDSCSSNLLQFYLPVLKDLVTCFLLAVLIDLDHVFAAGGLNIFAMATLERRPVMHNTCLVLLISAGFGILAVLSSYQSLINFGCSFRRQLQLLWLHFLVASLTHHIRDGLRHGLNIWPLGCSTSPVPLSLYFGLLLLFPLLVAHLVLVLHLNFFFLEAGY